MGDKIDMNSKKFFLTTFIVILILEIFVFNFRTWQSMGYKADRINDYTFSNDVGVISNKDMHLRSDGDKYIEIPNINKEIKNIYIDIADVTNNNISNEEKKKLNITISATDEANELYFDLPQRTIISDFERSKFLKMELAGKSEKIKINLKNTAEGDFRIKEISINKKVPFSFNAFRIILLFLIVAILYCIRPSSKLYEYKFDTSSTWQMNIIIAFAFFNILFFLFLTNANPLYKNAADNFSHHKQYQELTNAIIGGHFYLDEEPPQALIDMENPYDSGHRSEVMRENGTSAKWDYAYYNGKYYVYFGITPVLLFYLPYTLITGGGALNTGAAIFISGALYIIGVLLLMSQIIKRWFKDTPFLIYMILSFLFINSTNVLINVSQFTFYNLPIILAITLAIFGLYFWISAIDDNNKLKAGRLFVGSLLIALIAGCRPQVLLAAFLSIPLFYKITFKDRNLFSKSSIKQTVLFIAPFIIFAIFIMYYNHARFGSPFDFGANYNLTTNDMTKRGFRLGRIGLGLFSYLVQSPVVSTKFPYISSVYFYNNYMGRTISESLYGGIFACHIILFANIFIFKLKNKLKEKGLFAFCLSSIIFSIIIVIMDTEMAGLLARYVTDFSWFMWLSCVIIVLSIVELVNKKGDISITKALYTIIVICFITSTIYNGASSIFENSLSIKTVNPALFYRIQYMFEFWL